MIHCGDLFHVLPTLVSESIDACVTDPPYELAFMGKTWDGTGVAFSVATWLEVLRVLKPGAHLVAFGGTRTFHRMTVAIEDAGFEIRDCLSWLYGSGFPKSLDVGRAIDKSAGAERTVIGERVYTNGTRGSWRKTSSDKYAQDSWTQDNSDRTKLDTAPATDLAKQWQGWGTALKPAWEPIIMARKPLRGTVAANVAQHGTGAINVDACRIESGSRPLIASDRRSGNNTYGDGLQGSVCVGDTNCGRWPANVLLDEEAAAMLDEQSGTLHAQDPSTRAHGGKAKFDSPGWRTERGTEGWYADQGGASRFFYVAKPSREERDMGCYDMPARSGGEATDRQDGSAGTNSPRAGSGRTGGARNIHPTVKPVELMRWLVRLVTPQGGTVLDPFMGSGTTGMACAYELRPFIGIEREAEYVEIAERRIAAVAPLFGEESA